MALEMERACCMTFFLLDSRCLFRRQNGEIYELADKIDRDCYSECLFICCMQCFPLEALGGLAQTSLIIIIQFLQQRRN